MDLPRKESGHDWLSASLFFAGDLHGAAGDRAVQDVVAPLVNACRDDVVRWFFLRYNEGGDHLRLRFFTRPAVLESRIWPRITRAAASSSLVNHLARTAYEPEVVRYGGPWGLVLAEEYFHASSETALALLRKVEPGDRPARLGKGLLTMLVAFHVFTRDAARASGLAQRYGTSYLGTWAPDPERQKEWYAAFEQGFDRQSEQLADYVEVAWDALEADGELTPELDVYRGAMAGYARRLRGLFDAQRVILGGEVATDWNRAIRWILPSYVHMTSNRLGVTIQEESYLSVLISKTLDAHQLGG